MNALPQPIVTAIILCIVLIVAIAGYNTGSNAVVFGLAAIPVVFLALGRPDLVMILIMASFHTQIKIPGFPASLDLSRVLTAFYVMTKIASLIIAKSGTPDRSPSRKIVILYLMLIIITMKVRGFGLRITGASQQGGGEALAQLLFIGLFLLRSCIILSERQWKTGLLLMAAGSMIPMLADLIYILSNGTIYHQYMFMSYTRGSLATGLFSETLGISWRLQRAVFAVPNLMMAVLFLRGIGKIRKMGLGLCMAFVFLLAGVSGHRVAIVYLLAMLFFYVVLIKPGRMLRVAGVSLAAFAVLVLLLTLVLPALPKTFQRAFAFLPNAPVSEEVRRDAMGTMHWRQAVWREALRDWREYLWIGKGLTIPMKDIEQFNAIQSYNYAMGGRADLIRGTILMRDYHNGPIAFLLDLGIGGILAVFGLMISLAAEGVYKIRHSAWNSSRLNLIHTLIITYIMTEAFVFVFVYGDVRSMMKFLFLGSIAQGIRISNSRITPPLSSNEQHSR